MTEAPLRFANVVSSWAAERTWDTLPGALSTVSAHMVWIESMITRSGFSVSIVVKILRRFVSAPSCTVADPKPNRWARMRTCALASSPEIYSTFNPASENRAAACSSRVDFPIPGSPPTKIAEAGTKPPPKTRSSSSIPEWVRGNGASWLAKSVSLMAFPFIPPIDPFLGPTDRPPSSTIVFHSPQASQRPDHFVVTLPHAEQE